MKPILIFPKPDILLRKKVRRPFPQPIIPSRAKQGLRLNSSFTLLKNNFKNGTLADDPAGFAPERTLVLETIGPVDKFYRAAAKIQGLEFVQEIVSDELGPDEDFYYLNDDGDRDDITKLKGYAYLTMANQEALNKLLGYWEKYTRRDDYKFPRGLGPLKGLFEHLHSIRYWDTEDRLRETGLIDDWRQRIEEGYEVLPVEIELWCHKDMESRISAESRVRQYIQNVGGEVLQTCNIEDINYHALLAGLPVTAVTRLIYDNVLDIELLRCDEIMYFRPSGQCMAPVFTEDEECDKEELVTFENNIDEINQEPIIALFDGLPLENHEWIKDYVIVDDPDGWSENYASSDQEHGTSMASLIIRGDMENSEGPIPRKIYCRPIMKPFPVGFDGHVREKIPDDILPIDILHRAVLRLFEPEGQEPAIAPSIKVINLSIADPNRLFDNVMSPWAKLIDYLSAKYNILFVISAGNHLHDIELGITNKEFSELSSEDKESIVLKGVSSSTHERRLMSPSESINAITVAAHHHDEVGDDEFYNQINPYPNRSFPSTINPVTWGKKRSVKPDILMPGGRATYRLKSYLDDAPAVLEVLTFNKPPGQKVATPGKIGSLSSYAHTFGTSNSAALASRRLGFLNETIQDLYFSSHGKEMSHEYENVLLKSLICHGASSVSSFYRIEEILKSPKNSNRFKSISAKYLGYGNVDENRIHGCLDNQATIIQCGSIKQDDTHTYKFTLPDSINAKAVNKRLIITLAWLSPINAKNNGYRMAHLFYEPATGDKADNYLDLQSRETDWQMVRNGTVQHEVLTGDRASAFSSGTNIEIAIQCKGQAGAKDLIIPYGLVVTLDTPDVDLEIYEEVKAGLEAQFKLASEIEKSIKT